MVFFCLHKVFENIFKYIAMYLKIFEIHWKNGVF